MGFLEDLISTGKSVAATAGKKTDEALQYSKLKIKESQVKSGIKSGFERLGEAIYEMKKSGETDNEEFDALIAEIDAYYDELQQIEEKFDELKKVVTCPGCGIKTKSEFDFCPKCGTKLPERKVEEEPAPEEEAPADDIADINDIDEDKED